jgi:hypothetical protein
VAGRILLWGDEAEAHRLPIEAIDRYKGKSAAA